MELSSELIIDVPAATAWRMLGTCWGHIGSWAAPIISSSVDREGVGAVRTCHIPRFGPVPAGVIKERLLEFDAPSMTFAYEAVEGLPSFIERAANRWSVHALDENRCVVRSAATVTLRGPMALLGFLMARNFRASGARVLEELRHRLEHGTPHPRKVSAMRRAKAAFDPLAFSAC